jgi:aminoglycoside phosphotransferase (APT) family kinase protein
MDGQPEQITRSSRDPAVLKANFERWLMGRLPGREPTVTDVRVPESNGMSSETLLLDATWNDDQGMPQVHHLVARVAPADVDVPVFPTYDLSAQFQVMQLVGANSEVPVPATLWLEEDPGVVDAVFFVMERVDGRVPPDNLPYTFEGWLLDADPADRRHLQDATTAVLAGIHAIDLDTVAAGGTDISFLSYDGDGDTPLRRHVQHWRQYYEWMRGDSHLPLAEAAFAWLDDRWPTDEGPAVLTWGDARIGNMIYQGFTPAAVLDWEMAGIGPAGIDVGWMMFLHTFFQDLAEMLELPGLPDMFSPDDVTAAYTAAGGTPIADLDFYIVYAALRHALVMARVHTRRVHFGEAEATADPDDAIMHRARLTKLLAD